jgi:hypothetical protein
MRIRLDPWEASCLVNLGLLRASIQSEKQAAEIKRGAQGAHRSG